VNASSLKRIFCVPALLAFLCAGVAPVHAAPFISSLSEVNVDMFRIYPDKDEHVASKQLPFDDVVNGTLVQNVNDVLLIEQNYPLFGDKNLDNAVTSFLNDAVLSFILERNAEYRELKASNKSFIRPWHRLGKYLLFSAGKDCVTVLFSTYVNTGGMHGGIECSPLTVMRSSGKQLGIRDLFSDVDLALRIMSNYATARLSEQIGSAFNKNGAEPRLENFKHLFPVRDGIVVIFPEYQVAPYASGMQVVTIPLTELRKAAPNSAVWGQNNP